MSWFRTSDSGLASLFQPRLLLETRKQQKRTPLYIYKIGYDRLLNCVAKNLKTTDVYRGARISPLSIERGFWKGFWTGNLEGNLDRDCGQGRLLPQKSTPLLSLPGFRRLYIPIAGTSVNGGGRYDLINRNLIMRQLYQFGG